MIISFHLCSCAVSVTANITLASASADLLGDGGVALQHAKEIVSMGERLRAPNLVHFAKSWLGEVFKRSGRAEKARNILQEPRYEISSSIRIALFPHKCDTK